MIHLDQDEMCKYSGLYQVTTSYTNLSALEQCRFPFRSPDNP